MQQIAYSAANQSPERKVKVHSKEFINGIEHLIDPAVLKTLYSQRKQAIQRVLAVQKAQRVGIIRGDKDYIARESEINSSFSKEWTRRITKFQHGPSIKQTTARCA